jgi:hypothetical protein
MKKLIATIMDSLLNIMFVLMVMFFLIVTMGLIMPICLVRMLLPLIGYSIISIYEWSHNTPITFKARIKTMEDYEFFQEMWGLLIEIFTLRVFKDLKKVINK